MTESHIDGQMLKAILESVGEGILVVNNEGKVVLSNRRFASMWNIPDKIINSRDDDKFLHAVLAQLEDPKAFIAKVKKLYKSADEDFDTIPFKDGRVFERISRPIINEGKIAGRVWSFRDITQQKRVEQDLMQSRQKYRKLFTSSNDAIIVHSLSGFIVDVNAKALELFGYKRSEMLGLQVIDLHPSEAFGMSNHALEKIRKNGSVEFKILFKNNNGDTFPAQVLSGMFQVGSETLIQALVSSVSEDYASCVEQIDQSRNVQIVHKTIAHS
jgi:PAS domain S-box-containing protein